MVKSLPVTQETRVQSSGLQISLEKEMATHSSIPAWRIPWTEHVDYNPWDRRVRHDWATNTFNFKCENTKFNLRVKETLAPGRWVMAREIESSRQMCIFSWVRNIRPWMLPQENLGTKVKYNSTFQLTCFLFLTNLSHLFTCFPNPVNN